ncbi:threonine ammonia-lyase IlvA [Paenibacillus elgii]|uniref:L-threonine dehydratase n=1 Tax=Paenibacillus elgii TaxID=189691 RepID=A0A165Q4D7_9BACL|nr:threonine ammonia-lyase IlvA [Paenibacillus elgii]KZE73632.1 threonine dehydratase [Paenibacillus elgii]NEN80841.1 threonine ammonia-lyase IlvA [Paenibacillus elgii]
MTALHIKLEDILVASHLLKDVVYQTPLQKNFILSEKYGCNVFLKREDLQVVRSFKIRGAYNMIRSLPEDKLSKGVVCASAGNHAQGVAYSCKALQIPGKIFMPTTTPRQKISQVKLFGGPYVDVVLTGDTFDDSLREALEYGEREGLSFVHPFDHPKVIAGQGTVGLELMNDMQGPVDYVFAGIGGGGLIAGMSTYIKGVSPSTRVIGVETTGAPSMRQSVDSGEIVTLGEIDKFVDGTAVKRVGELTYDICRESLDDIIVVPEGKVCTTILELYNENAIVAEPAGALSVAALEFYREQIAGKNVVCVISGGNNDIDRMQEIKERSLIYEGLKHYFIVNFPQRAGALREFLEYVLGPTDDITRFEYTKKTSKENGPALVGIELKHKDDYGPLIERMEQRGLRFSEINKDPNLFNLLI